MASFAAFDVGLPVQVFEVSSAIFSIGESFVTAAGETEIQFTNANPIFYQFSAVEKDLQLDWVQCYNIQIDKYFSF